MSSTRIVGPELAATKPGASSVAEALGSISVLQLFDSEPRALAIGRRVYNRPPRPRAESPSICHTGCHTELEVVDETGASL